MCAVVLVRDSVLHADEVELRRFEDEVRALAGRIADTGPGTLRIAAPVWASSGCVAGEIGAALVGRLTNALGTRVVTTGDREVALELAVLADTLTVTARVGAPGGLGTAVPGFTVPASLFDLRPAEDGACRGREALGADPPDAARVTVAIDSAAGLLCERQETRATIRVDRPSWVRLFSVLADGTAWQVWPEQAGQGRVDRELVLGPLAGAIVPGHPGDESLVAVAVPLDAGSAPRPGFCRLRSGFARPAGAAVGVATFRVIAGHGCPDVDPAAAAALRDEFDRAPECP